MCFESARQGRSKVVIGVKTERLIFYKKQNHEIKDFGLARTKPIVHVPLHSTRAVGCQLRTTGAACIHTRASNGFARFNIPTEASRCVLCFAPLRCMQYEKKEASIFVARRLLFRPALPELHFHGKSGCHVQPHIVMLNSRRPCDAGICREYPLTASTSARPLQTCGNLVYHPSYLFRHPSV